MRLFLTVLLLAVLFSITQAAKWGNNQRFQNMCERNITGYRNYIDGLFNVSIKKLADVLLGEPMYTTRYKDVRGSTGTEFQQYMQLAKDIHDEVATPWNENQNGWIRRRVIYGLHVHENAFVKHANVGENQTALYQDELLILSKQARNLDTFIQGILIEVEYCGVRATGRDTYLEVDVKLTVDGTLLSLFDDNIMESSDQGFVLTYGILRWLLKDYIPQHPEDPVLISVQPTTEQIVIPSFFDSKDPFKSIKMMTNIPVTTVDPVVASSPTAFKILLLLLGAIVIVGIVYAAYRVVKKYVCPMIRISKEVRVTQNRFKNNRDEGLINEELAKRSRKESDV